ncbi:hypothetical protein NLJ89_g5498 [Agrocybe chaxingu]|uniref:AA9 family lytic polysaccharide monooxygenase n=1 Tax=Agrocybe chaxingu TaxID=84603 RepID=A0A9W8K0W9_9AGAR|nr:hypothetical protein NLJ89_g5498 [Agrocybe chaxingu]
MYNLTAFLFSVLLAASVAAKTVFSELVVDGVAKGHAVGIRVPSTNAAITDTTSNNIICNTNFITPVSTTVIPVNAGSQVIAQFHKTSAGYLGPDPADPLDPTNKGPVLAYLAAAPSATQPTVTGLKWFKIWQDGYDSTTHQWGSDHLFINGGNATFTIPSCIASGQYLLRVESIALHQASSYPGAQFYMSCAQLVITGSSSPTTAATVSFPGAYRYKLPTLALSPQFLASPVIPHQAQLYSPAEDDRLFEAKLHCTHLTYANHLVKYTLLAPLERARPPCAGLA